MKLITTLIGAVALAAGPAAYAAGDPAAPANAAGPASDAAPANAAAPAGEAASAAAPANAAAPAAAAAVTPPAAPALFKADSEALAQGHVPPPPANKSQVVFFRSGAYAGAGVWYNVRENGAVLGKLTNQSWFAVVLDPGVHTFTAATENRTSLRLELEPGETQYVRGTVQMGLLVGEPKLSPADPAQFETHYAHMKAAQRPQATAGDAEAGAAN